MLVFENHTKAAASSLQYSRIIQIICHHLKKLFPFEPLIDDSCILHEYIRTLLFFSKRSISQCFFALILLDRIEERHHALPLVLGCDLKLYSTALILSNKVTNDFALDSKSWETYTGFQAEELASCEWMMLEILDYGLGISEDEYWNRVCKFEKDFEFYSLSINMKKY